MSAGHYYAQKVIPCECGSREPYWHGEIHREYCCDKCWGEMPESRKERTRQEIEPKRDMTASSELRPFSKGRRK